MSMLIFMAGCHGDIDLTYYGSKDHIYGKWIHEYTTNPSDGSMILYNFSSLNNLEKRIYIKGHPVHDDTTLYFGSYQIPSSNLLYEYINYKIENDTTLKVVNQSDTIIFEIEGENLHLGFSGRTYKQLSGKPNQILGGQFYNVILVDTIGIYLHEMNHFLDDTVHIYSSINYSSNRPKIWDFHTKYHYTFTDRFILMTSRRPGLLWRGYTFYMGDLILGFGRASFKKYYGSKNQPN